MDPNEAFRQYIDALSEAQEATDNLLNWFASGGFHPAVQLTYADGLEIEALVVTLTPDGTVFLRTRERGTTITLRAHFTSASGPTWWDAAVEGTCEMEVVDNG